MDNYNLFKRIDYFLKVARVRKLPNGDYRVLSEKGKNLGTFPTKEKAEKHLREVEYFKHKNNCDDNNSDDDNLTKEDAKAKILITLKKEDNSDLEKTIDLTKAEELSYSAIMRQLNQKADPKQVEAFMKIFKHHFDRALLKELNDPEKIALNKTLIAFNKLFPIKVNKNILKNAAVAELGDPKLVGHYLSQIVKFIMTRVSPEKRFNSLQNLKQKFLLISPEELSNKHMPASSALGQSITFVKHVLFNHEAGYIRQVLENLAANL